MSGMLFAIDTPTLNGLWQSDPYLHDGSAASIIDAIVAHTSLSIDTATATSLANYLNELNALAADSVDSDVDGFADDNENCINISNPSQLDSDNDGFGNRCDADTNNVCEVNFIDVSLLIEAFQTSDPIHDFNDDGMVNFLDYPIRVNSIFMSPGPSALATCE